jgi:hypothetical protein
LKAKQVISMVRWSWQEDAMAEHTAAVTVSFKPEQLEELRALASEENRSLAQQVRHLVARGLAAEYEPEGEAA